MKKHCFTLWIWVLILSILLSACAQAPETEAIVTESGVTETPRAATPIQQLSKELWVVESFIKGVETMVYGYYGVDYIGIIDGEYKIMFAEREIPEAMKEGVEIEPYEEHGPGIVDPEDIVGGIGENPVGTQPGQP